MYPDTNTDDSADPIFQRLNRNERAVRDVNPEFGEAIRKVKSDVPGGSNQRLQATAAEAGFSFTPPHLSRTRSLSNRPDDGRVADSGGRRFPP